MVNEITKTVDNGPEKDADFREVIEAIFQLQSFKGRRYGNSWCKHGEAISIFGNTSRKYDRIENMMKDFVEQKKPLPKPDSEESVAETVADLATYSILWMTWIKRNRPAEYESWITKIRKALEE